MADYLLRHEAPLSEEDWERLDDMVVEAARSILVGRRFIPTYGPVGAGLQVFHHPTYSGKIEATTSISGTPDDEAIGMGGKRYFDMPVLSKKFVLGWRDLETSEQLDIPIEFGPAVSAAKAVATVEDELIMTGNSDLGIPGIFTLQGRQTREMSGGWDDTGSAFGDVVAAIEMLTQAGYVGPYALVTNPAEYAKLHRFLGAGRMTEIDQIRELTTRGIYQTPVVPRGQVAVLSCGIENFDLVVGQDLVTGFVETAENNHYFRVMEIVAPRFKRPEAIVTLS